MAALPDHRYAHGGYCPASDGLSPPQSVTCQAHEFSVSTTPIYRGWPVSRLIVGERPDCSFGYAFATRQPTGTFAHNAITAAGLVVSGAKDLPDFGLIAARLAALLPGTRQVEPPWAGHLPTLDRPLELSGILTALLREIVPAG